MTGDIARASVLALAIVASAFSTAAADTPYDGSWSLSIMTDRGPCDPSYNFPVQITNGRVSFPGLVRASGRVASGGSVRVSVAVGAKSASGSGRLTPASGRGRWTGRSGSDRCSGHWTAQKY